MTPTIPQSNDARLAEMAPELAARVLELEAENKRLREGLDQIACAKRVSLDGVVVFESSHEFAERLQEIAEQALNKEPTS